MTHVEGVRCSSLLLERLSVCGMSRLCTFAHEDPKAVHQSARTPAQSLREYEVLLDHKVWPGNAKRGEQNRTDRCLRWCNAVVSVRPGFRTIEIFDVLSPALRVKPLLI